MPMIYFLHTLPSEEFAQRLRRRFPSLFGGGRREPSKPFDKRPTGFVLISNEEILEDLHYGRAA